MPSLAEVLWVVLGQAVTALGTVVGVRTLTQFLPPAAYGTLSLALGMSVLAISLVAAPLTQAAIHFYPAVVAQGSASELLGSLRRCYRTMAPWVLLAAVGGGVLYVTLDQGSPWLVLLLMLLLTFDCWRAANISLLSAARRQRHIALWTAADAWSRPLAGSAAVLLVGPTAIGVLAAYVLVSAALLVGFSWRLWPSDTSFRSASMPPPVLDARMWSYAVPLIPLGIIGWASNLGDRYFIGGLLSVHDAGLYAALYGLASSPFNILGGVVELALRPIYQGAVSGGEQQRSRGILIRWLLLVACPCALALVGFAIFHREIAAVFVGKPYRGASALMPWIGAGYGIRATSGVLERVCYAYGRTHRVLIIQLWGAAATLVCTPLGVISLGLTGAAMAVPAVFCSQLVAASVLARRTMREGFAGAATTPSAAPTTTPAALTISRSPGS
jgi:O-antigen/teichoic acid export membrane protein